jgi:hypothetical protein
MKTRLATVLDTTSLEDVPLESLVISRDRPHDCHGREPLEALTLALVLEGLGRPSQEARDILGHLRLGGRSAVFVLHLAVGQLLDKNRVTRK